MPRFIIFPLFAGFYASLGVIPFAIFIRPIDGINSRQPDGSLVWPTAIYGTILLALLFVVSYKYVFKLLFVSINTNKEVIAFTYPLQLRRKSYRFDEIRGFYFSHFYTRGGYVKVMVFLAGEGITYRFSDFEISNFRKIEEVALQNFALLHSEALVPFSSQEKAEYLNTINKKFDLEQSREVRFTFYLVAGLILFILLIDWFMPDPDRAFSLILLLALYFVLVYSVYRIWLACRRINMLSITEDSPNGR
jgi:hypothetical protein